MDSDKFDLLIKERMLLSAVQPKSRETVDAILAWLDDPTGLIKLNEEQEAIFKRWKQIHSLRMDGKTIPQIIENITKFFGVSDRTVRQDLKNVGRVFKTHFDSEVELQIIYERLQRLISRYELSTNPKILALIPKLIKEQKEIALQLKSDSLLNDPELLRPHTFIITTNPKDIGIEEDLPSQEELMKKFKKHIDKVIEDIDHEEL